LVVRWQSDSGSSPAGNPAAAALPGADIQYMLRWETLESNRDLPRDVSPSPTPLELYAFRRPQDTIP
jgi:hypothetical protein